MGVTSKFMLTESEHHINHKHVSPRYINLIARIIIIVIDDVIKQNLISGANYDHIQTCIAA